ncbi:type II secretion system inner membrane protein GspF [Henriciella aquimarina]|uniref:type II secretion system inner membrane protein GspF n=1 Tax=Henriciella aquimarina TaxID=545261 RepID=UPI0009FBEC06|nr:type II secretion system inner membrane protein GspF [Henriciella aquimarina]
MAVYDYQAIGTDGKRTSGVITADSPRAARRELRLRQLSPLDVSESRKGRSASAVSGHDQKLSGADLVVATRQLALLVKSGTPVEEAIGSVAAEAEKPATRKVFMGVRSSITDGFSVPEALNSAPKAFPPFYRAVISAGQSSGRLDEVMDRLANHLEKARKIRNKIMSALIYPIVLSVIALVVVTLLMIFVVPAIVEQFDTLGEELPWLTEVVIAVSGFLRQWGLVLLLVLIAAGWALRRLFRRPAMAEARDRVILSLPVIGKLARGVAAAAFARTFATLSASGAPVPECLAAARNSMSNAVFRKAVTNVRRRVEEGASLARAMRAETVFPPMLLHMVASGERGGDLAGMMERAANYLEDEFDNASTVALGLLEPLMIVFLASIVALIVLAIMLPILQINTLAIG